MAKFWGQLLLWWPSTQSGCLSGHEPPRDDEDKRVEEGDVVGGQQDSAAGRDALGSDDPQVGQQPPISRASGARRS
jgi:hypothetical protein